MKYPPSKLEQLLMEYNGPMNHGVFTFMDSIPDKPQSAREALGYNSKQITNYSDPEKGLFYMRTTSELLLMGLRKEELQSAIYWLMKQKYPDWDPGE